MHVLAIISRDLDKGSTKYRLVQYLEFLASRGVTIEFVRRDAIDRTTIEKACRADLLFNQKCLIRQGLARQLIEASRRVVFDFDDAIYSRPGRPFSWFTQFKVNQRLRLWLRRATLVTPANDFLAGFARRFSSTVEVVPMALDLDIWRPRTERSADEVTIGWAGAPVNIPLLERLEPVLAQTMRRFPHVRLKIFSGCSPRMEIPFDYHPFQPGAEPAFVAGLDIGLLPLADEEFTRGKSPIKSLQYLACEVPVIGNVFGATAEILRPDNSLAVVSESGWLTGLERLVTSPDLRRSMGSAGRQFVMHQHNVRNIEKQLWHLIAHVR